MENMYSKQKGSSSSTSSSSSSIATDLFGPKDTPSTSVFGSVFGPPSTGRIMQSPQHGGPSNISSKDHKNTYYSQEAPQPCHYSSSIYYGGQDDYSTSSHNTESHQNKKTSQDDGSDEREGHGASRGNWWQGSLYY